MNIKKNKFLQQLVAMVLCLCLGAGTIISSGYASAEENSAQTNSEWGGVNSNSVENPDISPPEDVEEDLQTDEETQDPPIEEEIIPEDEAEPTPEEEVEPTPEASVAPDDVMSDDTVPEDGETVEPEVPEEVEVQLSVKKSVEVAEDESLKLRYEAWVDTVEEQEKIADTGFTVLLPEDQTWNRELSDPDGQIGYFDVQRDNPEWETYVGDILDPLQENEIWTDAVVWVPQEGKVQPDSYVYFVDVPEDVQDVSELNPVLFVADGEFVNVKYESDWENAKLLNQPEETPEPTVTPAEATPSPEEPPVQEEQQPVKPDAEPDTDESPETSITPLPEEEQTPAPEVSKIPKEAKLTISRSIYRDDNIYLKYAMKISKAMCKEISSASPFIILFPEGQTPGQQADQESGFVIVKKGTVQWDEMTGYLKIQDNGMYSCAAIWSPQEGVEIPEKVEYSVVIPDEAGAVDELEPALFFCGKEKIESVYEDDKDELQKEFAVIAGDRTLTFTAPSAPNADAVFVFMYYCYISSTSSYESGEVRLAPNESKTITVPISNCTVISAVYNLMEGYIAYNDIWTDNYGDIENIKASEPKQISENMKSSTLTLRAPTVTDTNAYFIFNCYLTIHPTNDGGASSITGIYNVPQVTDIKAENYCFMSRYDPENEWKHLYAICLSFSVRLKQGESLTIGGLNGNDFAVDVKGNENYILNRDRWTGYIEGDRSYNNDPVDVIINPAVLSENGSVNDYSVAFEKLSDEVSGMPNSGLSIMFSHNTVRKEYLAGAVLQITGRENNSSTDIEPITWTTGEGVKYIILKPGKYVLKEIEAPPGYSKSGDIEFEVTLNGEVLVNGMLDPEAGLYSQESKSYVQGEGNRLVPMLDQEEIKISIIKKDERLNTQISGAEFEIIGNDLNGDEITPIRWTSDGTPHTVHLSPGTYTLSEITAPAGYSRITESLKFEIKWDAYGYARLTVINGGNDTFFDCGENGNVIYTDKITAYNYRKQAELRVEKLDSKTNKPVAGATLQVTGNEVSGKQIDPIKWMTDTEPHALVLNPGTYTLSEISAPSGYEIAENVNFIVNDEYTIRSDVDGDSIEAQNNYFVLKMLDDRTIYPVEFFKYSIATSGGYTHVPGAEFLLTTSDSSLNGLFTSQKWITDSSNHVVYLYPGEYTLSETGVPSGFFKAEDTDFRLDDNGKITIIRGRDSSVDSKNALQINIYNAVDSSTKYLVEFNKLDFYHRDVFVSGAHLILSGTTFDGINIDPVRWTSGNESYSVQLAPGNYKVEEAFEPNGYLENYDQEICFVLHEDGSIEIDGETKDSVDVYNVKDDSPKFPVTFYKQKSVVDKDNDPNVYGAVLEITGKDNPFHYTISRSSTLLDEPTVYLIPGTYILREEQPPGKIDQLSDTRDFIASLSLSDDIEFTVTDNGKVLIDGKEQGTSKVLFNGEETETASVIMYDDPLIYVLKYSTDNPGFYGEGTKLKVCGSKGDGTPDYNDVIDQWTVDFSETCYHFSAFPYEIYTQSPDLYNLLVEEGIPVSHAVHVPADKMKNGIWLIEDSAPEGYLPSEPVHITVDDLYNFLLLGATLYGYDDVEEENLYRNIEYSIVAMNDPQKVEYDIPFNKYNFSDQSYVSGATLQLTSDVEDFVTRTWVTGDETHIESLYPGTYSLSETNVPDGYVKADDIIFTITEDGHIEINNVIKQSVDMIDKEVPKIGSLSISKTISGSSGDTNFPWTFIITLSGDGFENFLNTSYGYTSTGTVLHTEGDSLTDAENDGAGTIQFAIGKAIVKLKHGQSITINGLPAGISYTVAEAEANQSGYKTTSTGDTGTVPDSAASNATFTNLAPAKLRIRKVDQNNRDILDNPAKFTLTQTGSDSSNHDLQTANTSSGTETWALTQEITLSPGTYSVVESQVPNGYTASTRFTDGSFTFTVKDDMTIDTTDIYGEGAKISFNDALKCYILEIANTKNTGSLTVSKTVTGSAGETDRLWTFTVTLSGSGFESALNATYNYTSTNTVTPQSGDSLTDSEKDGTGTITFTSGTATFSLKHNQSIKITGLPQGITYTVAETEANQNGYATTSTGANGSISETESTAVFTNAKDMTAVLPDSGGPGTTGSILISLGFLLTFVVLVAVLRKRRK